VAEVLKGHGATVFRRNTTDRGQTGKGPTTMHSKKIDGNTKSPPAFRWMGFFVTL